MKKQLKKFCERFKMQELRSKLDGMELASQHIVMSKDLNAHGNLFGGTILAWIDEGCAMYVMERIKYSNIVTVNMQDVNFSSPGRLGDIVQIYAKIEKTGTSSITICSKAISNDVAKQSMNEIITCKITYVCLDDFRKPFPYFKKSQFEI